LIIFECFSTIICYENDVIVLIFADVSAPFKIFSTLIRGLDNELAPSRKDEKDYPHDMKNDED